MMMLLSMLGQIAIQLNITLLALRGGGGGAQPPSLGCCIGIVCIVASNDYQCVNVIIKLILVYSDCIISVHV